MISFTTVRRRLGLTVLVGLVVAFGYLVKSPSPSRLTPGGAASPLESRWHTEEEWLVDSIARDLGEMARFSSAGRLPASGDVVVSVSRPSTGPGSMTIAVVLAPGVVIDRAVQLSRFVWSPDDYQDLARALLDAAGGEAASAPPEANDDFVATSLTDLRPTVIEKANERVSGALARRFTDPALHESAALVLAAFALREGVTAFSDPRATLCRMTAHLALAGALRRGDASGMEGRIAKATLLLLSGRGAEAASALDELDRAADPGLGPRAWRRALRLRLTEDTRSVVPTTLLERRELYRALVWTVAEAPALPSVARLAQEELTDWWRLASEPGFSVEMGNTLLARGLDQELSEISEVWAMARERPLPDAELVSALNEPAGRCVMRGGLRVISWGTWAAFFQRHLIECLGQKDHHVRQMLGLPGRADQEFQQDDRRFAELRLYPLLEVRVSGDAKRRPKRFDDMLTLARQHPELLSAWQWWRASEAARREIIPRGLPDHHAWFAPGLPRGTSFDVISRTNLGLVPRTKEAMRLLLALSPDDMTVMSSLVGILNAKEKADAGEVERLFGRRVDYDMRALNDLGYAAEGDSVAYGRVLKRQCALSPAHCFNLGDHLVEVGELAEAAAAFQRGMDLSPDQVMAANNSRWLVNHYLDVGDRSRARAVAEQAAGTGSGRGMISMSRFLERTGDIEGAEAMLRRRLERYGNAPQSPEERAESLDGWQDQDELIGLFYRMALARKGPKYQKRFLEMTRLDFPNGIEPADPMALSGLPADGVFVSKTSPIAERAGFRAGDIIVALDGIRIRTRRQYHLVRCFSDAPEMTLLVSRQRGIIEVKARSSSRWLGFDMRSHKPVSPAATAQRP